MPAKPQRLSLAQAVGAATPRGAAALFADTSTPGTELEGARRLPLALIDPNPQQARRAFDPVALQELADSISQHGVLEPILVRPVADRYQIIAGERRFRAAGLAGLADVPVIIQGLDDTEAAYATAVENLQREDLDLEDEARQFALLLELTGLSQRDLAKKLGINYNYISRRVRLLKQPDLLAAIRAGEITLFEALKQLDSGPAPPPAEQVEREDLDAAVSRRHNPRPGQPTSARWRYIEKAKRELLRIQPMQIPEDERLLWAKELQEMEAYIGELRRALEAREV